MSKTIIESGMEFNNDNSFYIEKSFQYTATEGKGIKSVEFIRVNGDQLYFIEAKSSFPNPKNPNSKEIFTSQIHEIADKFIHSLSLYSAIEVGIHEKYPDDFLPADKMSLKFIFVINNHCPKWCKPIKSGLYSTLPSYIKAIWKPEVYVIDHETALRINIVKRLTPNV
ncbi:MAG: hypothetical protein LBH91_04705 [Prevotellaceae bacterium]|jgi:hypothetical protein|nr:hypothetical protein [Prevotellaceae bacterium]